MTEELLNRINASLERLEEMENRVNTLIEGGRMQLSNLAEYLKIRELRQELRNIAQILTFEKGRTDD